MKSCNRKNCTEKNPQSLKNFTKSKNTKDGLDKACKTCNHNRSRSYYQKNKEKEKFRARAWALENKEEVKNRLIKERFKLSLEDYKELLSKQNNVCAICKKPEMVRNRSLAIDHDHKTGMVRGLLCTGCNTGLGSFKDDKDLLNAASQYLSMQTS